jgi:hypothetical protein
MNYKLHVFHYIICALTTVTTNRVFVAKLMSCAQLEAYPLLPPTVDAMHRKGLWDILPCPLNTSNGKTILVGFANSLLPLG